MAEHDPSTKWPLNQGEQDLPKIIIFAESGLLAGDLAAWLSGNFFVTRVTSIPAGKQALSQLGGSLIIVEGSSQPPKAALVELVEKGVAAGCKVVMLGTDPEICPARWLDKVNYLEAVPDPAALFSVLMGKQLEARKNEA